MNDQTNNPAPKKPIPPANEVIRERWLLPDTRTTDTTPTPAPLTWTALTTIEPGLVPFVKSARQA